MTRSLLPLLLLAGVASAADPDARSPKDVFGRPRPHGEPIQKASVGLYAGRTDLFFGQPITVELFALPVTPDGPYVHPHLTPDGKGNVALTLTDDAGKAAPFVLESHSYGGSGAGEYNRFTLFPTKANSAGGYWTPNQYTLTATVTNPDTPTNPKTLPGKFVSNKLKLIVRAATAARDAADPKQEPETGPFARFSPDGWLFVAGLDDKSQAVLREKMNMTEEVWDAQVARFSVVTVPQDKPLTEKLAKQLVADLPAKGVGTRIRAIRNVPPGAGEEVIAALVARLADDYTETVHGGFQQYQTWPVRGIAADSLARLGREVILAVIAFGKDEKNSGFRSDCVRLLGRLGHHPDAEKWLLKVLDSDSDDWQYAAQGTAAKWGKAGADLSRKVVGQAKLRKEIRRDAIEALGKYGDLKTDGPLLRPLLASKEWDVQWAAVRALLDLKDAESLPEFTRIARDGTIDQNIRYPAVDAVMVFAKKEAADELLLELMKRPEDRLRAFALVRAGGQKLMAALPVALDALDDKDWYTRVMADNALRGLAGDRAGVGYDPAKPDSKAWRAFWAKKEKK